MISILGKRPFPQKVDEMDKWLDVQREKKRRAANPSEPGSEPPEGETPVPVLFKRLGQNRIL